jgi:hypothetical protein
MKNASDAGPRALHIQMKRNEKLTRAAQLSTSQ